MTDGPFYQHVNSFGTSPRCTPRTVLQTPAHVAPLLPLSSPPSSALEEHALQRRDAVHRTEYGFGEHPCQTALGMKAFHVFERPADGPEPIVDHLPFVAGQRGKQVFLAAVDCDQGAPQCRRIPQ